MPNFSTTILCATSTIADGNMSLRLGEVAQVMQNRTTFLQRNNVDFGNHVCMQCDHGEKIIAINRDMLTGDVDTYHILPAEVLVTQERGIALMLLTADCLPVSFYDPVTQTIALAHFSRQTIAQLLPQKTIRFLETKYGIVPANVLVHIGPHIGAHSYHFPLPLLHIAPALQSFITEKKGEAYIDLVGAHNHQLLATGVAEKNITVSTIDTAISPKHFSYFRSQHDQTPDGRLATILMLALGQP